MKVLFVTHKVQVPVIQHILDLFENNGIKTVLEIVPEALKASPWKDVWGKFKTKQFYDKTNKACYDYIISNTHSSYIPQFFENVKPKIGFIDIEHDLFSFVPEYGIKETTIFTFHDKHYEFCLHEEINAVRCKWPLLNVTTPKTTFSAIDKWEDAIFIGSYLFNKDKDYTLPVFKTIWHKKYRDDDFTFKDMGVLPTEFCGPIGTKLCAEHCNFFITLNSSCFVEALLLGCLPIILPDYIIDEKIYSEVLSEVTIKNGPSFIENILAVTTTNLSEKLSILRFDQNLFKETIQSMLNNWVKDDYYTLPDASKALLDFITGGC